VCLALYGLALMLCAGVLLFAVGGTGLSPRFFSFGSFGGAR